MCKRQVLLRLIGVVLLLPILTAAASDNTLHDLLSGINEETAASEPVATVETAAELLVTYPDAPTAAQSNSLAGISRTLVSLGRTADFVPESAAVDALSSYDIILCYAYTGDAALGRALADADGRLYFLGGKPPAALAPSEGYTLPAQSRAATGIAGYTFAGNEAFTAAVEVADTAQPVAPEYAAGALSISGQNYPLATGWGTLRYLPLTDYTTAFAQAVLMQEITLWLWPYNDKPNTYAEFVVLDGVYPFTDPDKLLGLVEQLATDKTPFAISVMPIYANADFPAMQQFCEVLRYAQANGGTIVLHAPLMQNAPEVATLQQKLTDATQNYFANGVYPVALEIPASWVYDSAMRETLGRYRTLLLYEDGVQPSAPEQLAQAKQFLALGSQVISPVLALGGSGAGQLDCCATALYLSVEEANDVLLGRIQAAGNSAVPLKSLWAMNHTVYLNDSGLLQWDGTNLTVNGNAAPLDYTPQPYPEKYDYQRTIYYRATADLSNQNHLLISLALAALIAFLLFILLARRQMRRRFYLSSDPDENGKTT